MGRTPLVTGLHERLAAAAAARLVHGSAWEHHEELAAIEVYEKVRRGAVRCGAVRYGAVPPYTAGVATVGERREPRAVWVRGRWGQGSVVVMRRVASVARQLLTSDFV
jgi:hypothetical protein